MILVTGTVTLQDGNSEAMAAAIRPMVAASRAEPGCHACVYGQDLDDPNTFTYHEAWESQEAAMAHGQSPHMAAFAEVMMPILAGPLAAEMWAAEATSMG
jgi:quinol monooxygenase YgiN